MRCLVAYSLVKGGKSPDREIDSENMYALSWGQSAGYRQFRKFSVARVLELGLEVVCSIFVKRHDP